MATLVMPDGTQYVLTSLGRKFLEAERRRLSKKAEMITVGEYERPFYQLTDPRAKRLARWEDVESAVRRLCKDRDRGGRQSGDAEMARRTITLLQDTFKG